MSNQLTRYRGRGNHSVYELEALVAEREEEIYQRQLKFQDQELRIKQLENSLNEIRDSHLSEPTNLIHRTLFNQMIDERDAEILLLQGYTLAPRELKRVRSQVMNAFLVSERIRKEANKFMHECLSQASDLADKYFRELNLTRGLLDDSVKMIHKVVDASLFSASETDRICKELFPKVESCDCEPPCDCQYPLGYLDLKGHKYHCYGTEIMANEFLDGLEKKGVANAKRK